MRSIKLVLIIIGSLNPNILLGDVYFKEEDYFNAEATLKSVIENSTIPELQERGSKEIRCSSC
jgi:hypothetical protein